MTTLSTDWFVETDTSPAEPSAMRAGPIDHALVAAVRRSVIAELASEIQVLPVGDAESRYELGRSMVAAAVSAQGTRRQDEGLAPWTVADELALVDAVLAALFGLGRLQPLVDDPSIENIEANGCDDVWLCYADGRVVRGPAIADTDEELVELIQSIGARAGSGERTFTTAHPSLHLRLADGSRLAAIAWTCPRPQLVIRRHRIRNVDLDDLVQMGSLTTIAASYLRAALHCGRNIIVSGLQNAGKTTLIRTLANEFGPSERFATIEREFELHLHDLRDRHPRIVALEAREGSGELDSTGRRSGEVSLRDLVVDALRLNVRRIIVGEVRGDEVVPMLEAMSTGDGSLCTLHARSAGRALDRLVTLSLSSGATLSDSFAQRLVAGAVDIVVHVDIRHPTAGPPQRFISEILEIDGIGEFGRPITTRVFVPNPAGRARPSNMPRELDRLVAAGFDAARFEHELALVEPSWN